MEKSARDAALDYLKRRERTAAEVKKHLTEKEYPPEEIQEAVSVLREYHYIDDARYCRAYLNYAMEKGRGPLRVRQELADKGVDKELARAAIEEAYDREAERALALQEARKALGILAEDGENGEDGDGRRPEEKDLARIARRLTAKGFSNSTIYDTIGKLKDSR